MKVKRQRTEIATEPMLTPHWWIVDAKNLVVGRLASQLAKYLQGKHKPCYTPNINCGDKVVVTNVEKVRFTGRKFKEKEYLSYTGYPGGQRMTTPERLFKKGQAERVLRKALRSMLPKNKLRARFMANCYLFIGESHPHSAQAPTPLKLVL